MKIEQVLFMKPIYEFSSFEYFFLTCTYLGYNHTEMDNNAKREIDEAWVDDFVVVVFAMVAVLFYYMMLGSYIEKVLCRTSWH